MNANSLVPPTVADTMLAVLRDAGYSLAECQIIRFRRMKRLCIAVSKLPVTAGDPTVNSLNHKGQSVKLVA